MHGIRNGVQVFSVSFTKISRQNETADLVFRCFADVLSMFRVHDVKKCTLGGKNATRSGRREPYQMRCVWRMRALLLRTKCIWGLQCWSSILRCLTVLMELKRKSSGGESGESVCRSDVFSDRGWFLRKEKPFNFTIFRQGRRRILPAEKARFSICSALESLKWETKSATGEITLSYLN